MGFRVVRGVSLCVFLWTSIAVSQVIPGRYVVELSTEPIGAEVRAGNRATLAVHHSRIATEQARVRRMIEQQNGVVVSATENIMNGLIVRIPDDQVQTLSSIPGVQKVYQVHEAHALLDHALPLIHAPEAWARIGGVDHAGAGIKIGILDTGISPDHPAFKDPSLKMPAGYPLASSPANLKLTTTKIIVARSYEDVYQEKTADSAQDRFGHGTGVASCAAGVLNKGPLATFSGVAPKAWIGGYKIVQQNQGSASTDVIVKAMDDALADGMDVVNLSFGSSFPATPDTLEFVAVDRLTRFGVVFVTSAGNSGPGLDTIGNFAGIPSAIGVGASENSRFFANAVSAAGTTYVALRGTGPRPSGPVSGAVLDVTSADPTGLLCSALPSGGAAGKIVLILRGTCTFEAKVNNAASGGAIGAIIYAAASSPGLITPSVGAATLPTVFLANADGAALKATVAKTPATVVTLNFDDQPFPTPSNLLASFSSRGPNIDEFITTATVKPDVTAPGDNIYMAAESVDPTGGLYSADGYLVAAGTSFSSPLTAGAVAVLRGAHPGLTVDQYRSLIINTASPLMLPNGSVERVQQVGAGILNLDAALQGTVTAFPTSLTFGVGNGSLGGATTGDFNQLTISNVGAVTDSFAVSAVAFDYAPALRFSVIPGDTNPNSTLSLTIDPGKSKTVYTYWTTSNTLNPGEYQGLIDIQSVKTGQLSAVPYWYGVPTSIPRAVLPVTGLPTTAAAGSSQGLLLRVTDDIGYPVLNATSLAFQGKVVSGGGTVTLAPTTFITGLLEVIFKLGPNAGDNTFQFSFGQLPALTVTITGTKSN